MNCGLLRDNHKHSPYQRIHIEVLHFIFWFAFELLSQVRVDFLEVWDVGTRYAEIVRHFLRQVSLHVRSTLHLLATLENAAAKGCDTPAAGVPARCAMRFEPC